MLFVSQRLVIGPLALLQMARSFLGFRVKESPMVGSKPSPCRTRSPEPCHGLPQPLPSRICFFFFPFQRCIGCAFCLSGMQGSSFYSQLARKNLEDSFPEAVFLLHKCKYIICLATSPIQGACLCHLRCTPDPPSGSRKPQSLVERCIVHLFRLGRTPSAACSQERESVSGTGQAVFSFAHPSKEYRTLSKVPEWNVQPWPFPLAWREAQPFSCPLPV